MIASFLVIIMLLVPFTSVTGAIDNTSNEEAYTDADSLANTVPSDFVDKICDCLYLLTTFYNLIIVIPLMMLLEQGLLTMEQVLAIALILETPMYPLILLYVLLDCKEPDWPDWWFDPWLNSFRDSENLIKSFLSTYEGDII